VKCRFIVLVFGITIVFLLGFSDVFEYYKIASAITEDPVRIDAKTESIIPRTIQFEHDSTPPSIRITNPTFCSGTYAIGTVTVEGTAYDSEGVKKVEAFANTIPHNGEFPFKIAHPASSGNWSRWSIPISIPNEQPYRIMVHSFDNTGNENWDESMINSERTKKSLEAIKDESGQSRIAFVEPTFTNAAYNEDSFYFFYSKYQNVPIDQEIATDLNLMTGDIPFESDYEYFESIFNLVKQSTPNSIVSIIGDEEIHDGMIFKNNGSNAYNVLILLHNEYVTQAEYDNLKKFLINGGSIILLNGNVFYAQVLYDKESCTVTLVKGHDWEFDGKSVRKSVSERYQNDNSEWFGSNFNVNDINDKIVFENNPFNYKHFEENYLTNQKAKILIDYKAKFPQETFAVEKNPWVIGGLLKNQTTKVGYRDEGKTIATYELPSGAGKVINMGIYSQNIESDPTFLNYFEKIILPRALDTTFRVNEADDESNLYWMFPGGKISEIHLDRESKTLSMRAALDHVDEMKNDSFLTIVLPKKIIDAHSDNKMIKFIVTVNGTEVPYDEASDDVERGLKIKISENSDINIIGTSAIPEFNGAYILSTMFFISVAIGLFLFNLPRTNGFQYK